MMMGTRIPSPSPRLRGSCHGRDLLPTLALVVSTSGAAAAQLPTERVEHTVEVTGNPLVRVMNFAGHVEIHGTDPGEDRTLRVVGVKRLVRALPPEEAARLFKRINLDLRHRGRRIEVSPYGLRARHGKPRLHAEEAPDPKAPITEIRAPRRIPPVSVDIELWLPAGLSLEVHTFSAPITLSGLSAPEGTFRARSISGSLVVEQVEGHEVRAETVSADLRASDVISRRSLFKTLTATIRVDGAFHPDGWYELQTHSGPVIVGLGGTPGFALDATSYTGEVRNELEIEGEAEMHHLAGRRGLEGPHIVVNTFSGPIHLTEGSAADRRAVTNDR